MSESGRMQRSIEGWRASGEPKVAFARANGVSRGKLEYWTQRLRDPAPPWGEALRYRNHPWRALNRYIEVGRRNIDNQSSRTRAPARRGRRGHWMFAGSLDGARWAATLYSLVRGCGLAGIDPIGAVGQVEVVHFRDVLKRVATHPQSAVGELKPKGAAATFARPSTETAAIPA